MLKAISVIVGLGGEVRAPIFALLAWFGCERRGVKVVGGISRALKEYGLKTVPDFADVQRHDKYTMVEFQKGSPVPFPIPKTPARK